MSQSRQYFDNVAKDWDTMRRQMFGDGVRNKVIQMAQPKSDWIVADVGTGTGFLALGFAPLVKRVIGIDQSPEMIKIAEENLKDHSNFETRCGVFGSLPLGEGEVDAVVGNMILHHAIDPAGAIVEMARALKPGGVLVLSDADSHNYQWLREEHHDIWLGFERDRIREWFEQAGLMDVAIDCSGEVCCPVSEEHKDERPEITIWVGRGVKGIV